MNPITRQSWLGVYFAVICTLCGGTETLHAAIIYNNLGANDSFFVQPGTYPVWTFSSSYIHRAAAFTVPGTQNVKFTSADLGLFLQSGPNNALVQLVANGTGSIPGNVIENIGLQLPAPSANPVIATAVSQANPTLVAGSTYWIIASMKFAPSMATWGINNTGSIGGNATRTNFMNGLWFLQGTNGIASLRINAAPIPEPGTILMAALGVAAIVAVGRRKARCLPSQLSHC